MATLQGMVWFIFKLGEHDIRPLKFFIKIISLKYILDHEEEEEDLFQDVSQEVNNSVQSSY